MSTPLDQLASFTRHGVKFERVAALHGQARYKVTDRIGRTWLVARDGSVLYPWRCTLMEIGAEMFAATLDEAAEIIGALTSETPVPAEPLHLVQDGVR